MSLQFIIGSSGIGKTHYACQRIIQESLENPGKLYYIIVPEQFTMQTQKDMIKISPGHGIMNVDVQSFVRLAYRVFSETGVGNLSVLDDLGKIMILKCRKLWQRWIWERTQSWICLPMEILPDSGEN